MIERTHRIGGLRKICIIVWRDLGLLASLCFAQFIVWRTLRKQHRERAFRLSRIRLVQNEIAGIREVYSKK